MRVHHARSGKAEMHRAGEAHLSRAYVWPAIILSMRRYPSIANAVPADGIACRTHTDNATAWRCAYTIYIYIYARGRGLIGVIMSVTVH